MRHSSFLEVNLSLLARNVDKVKALSNSAQLIPMVKSDAYGNGLIPISRFLAQECDVKLLGCASLGEALKLTDELPQIEAEILVFSDTEILDQHFSTCYLERNILPVLHQKIEVEKVLNSPEFNHMPLYLKVDTGMNRLGLSLEELEQLAPRLRGRGVQHLMTHFACSYYPSRPGDRIERQFAQFMRAREILSSRGVDIRETSISNSGAIEQGIGIDESHVRPGLMLYGPSSVPHLWDGHQISRLVTRILKVFKVKKGTPIGYGVNVAPEDGWIAILPIGYGDGLLTYSSGASVEVKGKPGRIFGRVNMDMTFLWFDLMHGENLSAGEEVEIWNHDNKRISDFATQMKTIPYQLMCAISPRIPKVYKVK
jgi:alanine racemase